VPRVDYVDVSDDLDATEALLGAFSTLSLL
jgi:hypothetical protein